MNPLYQTASFYPINFYTPNNATIHSDLCNLCKVSTNVSQYCKDYEDKLGYKCIDRSSLLFCKPILSRLHIP